MKLNLIKITKLNTDGSFSRNYILNKDKVLFLSDHIISIIDLSNNTIEKEVFFNDSIVSFDDTNITFSISPDKNYLVFFSYFDDTEIDMITFFNLVTKKIVFLEANYTNYERLSLIFSEDSKYISFIGKDTIKKIYYLEIYSIEEEKFISKIELDFLNLERTKGYDNLTDILYFKDFNNIAFRVFFENDEVENGGQVILFDIVNNQVKGIFKNPIYSNVNYDNYNWIITNAIITKDNKKLIIKNSGGYPTTEPQYDFHTPDYGTKPLIIVFDIESEKILHEVHEDYFCLFGDNDNYHSELILTKDEKYLLVKSGSELIIYELETMSKLFREEFDRFLSRNSFIISDDNKYLYHIKPENNSDYNLSQFEIIYD